MRSYCFSFLLLTVLTGLLQAQPPMDSVLYGRNHYVAYFPGDLPLIISAPHGGSLTPTEIPDRTYGTMVTDDYTAETALAIRTAVFDYTGHYPHLILSYLKRTKLDPNREIEEAAQGNVYAAQAWREYHGFIDRAEDSVTALYGKGFYVDIHGHGHAIHRLELGYLLSASVLGKSNTFINNGGYANSSSIRALANDINLDFADLIRGYNSLGSLIARQGIRAVPSYDEPNPGSGNPYFSGGYSTVRHGSRDGGTISGLQIEAYRSGLRDTPANRKKYAQTLTKALNQYFRNFFGWNGLLGKDTVITLPPSAYRLEQNAPNPFHKQTHIYYELPIGCPVLFTVYNVHGEKIMQRDLGFQAAGGHPLIINTQRFASGIYFYRMQAGSFTQVRKMIMLH